MTQHYQIGKRYIVVRDDFGSGDDVNNLLYRPAIDALVGSEYYVIQCVETHQLKISGLDPNAPDDAIGMRFMSPDDTIWDCQYPTYLAEHSFDDHIDGNLLVTRTGAVAPDDLPFVDIGVVIGRLYGTLDNPNLTPEENQVIADHIAYMQNKIDELGMTGLVTIIYPPVTTPPVVADPEPEPTPPEETPEPTDPVDPEAETPNE